MAERIAISKASRSKRPVLRRAEGDRQQLFYFARDFLLDRFGRFFPWVDGAVSSTGRNAQICSLTSSN